MSKCKVTTTKQTIISKEEYKQYYDIVTRGKFLTSIQDTLKEIGSQCEMVVYQQTFELPLKKNIFGLYIVSVYVNGKKFRFLLDTGAQISGITQKCFTHLQLQAQQHLSIGSIGGTEKSLPTTIVDLQFGGCMFHRKGLIVLDDQHFGLRIGNINLLGCDGILGWDILSLVDFEIDDISKTLRVSKNRLKLNHPNMIVGGFPLIYTKDRHGKVLLFGFDSGSKVSWIHMPFAQKNGWEKEKDVSMMGFGVHGLEKMNIEMVKDVEVYVDRAKIQLSHVISGRCELFDTFTYDGIFGNEICKGRRIRFVNSRAMVLLV